MQIIEHPDMPKANGHYSMCTEYNGMLFVSGQLPFNADRKMPEGISAQTEQVFKNVRTILRAANSDLNKILSVRIYIPDVELWGDVNAVYEAFMGDAKPARCVVPTGKLHYGALIEVEVTAHV